MNNRSYPSGVAGLNQDPSQHLDPTRVIPTSAVNIVRTDDDSFVLYATFIVAPPKEAGPHAQPQAVRKTYVAQTPSEVFAAMSKILPMLCGGCGEK